MPSPYPSIPPTVGPSPAPIVAWANVNGNGGCDDGETLHQVIMYDAWGDGWDGTYLTIRRTDLPSESKTFTMEDNARYKKWEYLCLRKRRCYDTVSWGGLWQQEVRWEIKPIVLGFDPDSNAHFLPKSVAKGGAPQSCAFYVKDPNETVESPACPSTCNRFPDEYTSSPTAYPSKVPSTPPTHAPSSRPSDKPVTAAEAAAWTPSPSASPSWMPSLRPSAMPSKAPQNAAARAGGGYSATEGGGGGTSGNNNKNNKPWWWKKNRNKRNKKNSKKG